MWMVLQELISTMVNLDFSLGLHDDYWQLEIISMINIAIDLAASVMIVPGLEARLGYAHQERMLNDR